jgi:hypothetical protein
MEKFHDYRNTCISNQSLFQVKDEIEHNVIESLEPEGEFIEEDAIDIKDEDRGGGGGEREEHKEDESNTISESYEFIDDDYIVEEGEEEDEENENQEVLFAVEKIKQDESNDCKIMEHNKRIVKSASKNKGKELYQKLLQKCTICSKMIEKNRMDGHINKHNNLRPYECKEKGCNKTFYCRQLLRLHTTSIHTNNQVACEICEKIFPSARALYSHMLRHKNEGRYSCELCAKTFNSSNSLKRHKAIHSGIR